MLRVNTTVLLSLVLLCLSIVSQLTSAINLYPECGDYKLYATVMPNKTTTLYTSRRPTKSFSLDCFASEVFSIKGGQNLDDKNKNIDYCHVESQSEYRYSLAVRATYKDEKGVNQIEDFPIRDLYAGSLSKPIFRMSVPSDFSIVFTNLAQSDRCTLGINATFTYLESDDSYEVNNTTVTPALVAIRPPTVYSQFDSETFLVLQYPKNIMEEQVLNSVVRLVDLHNSCEKPGAANYANPNKKLPDEFYPTSSSQFYHSHVYNFKTPGSYRVCYKLNDTSTAHQLGIVTTFKGNPSYYDTINSEESDVIPAHTPLFIRFHGYMLDTRKDSDIAKLVYEDESCIDGPPAGEVSATAKLLPEGNYGYNSTYTVWRVVITKPGNYKVCYKRRSSEWIEIFSKNIAWPNDGPKSNSTHRTFPIPIDPVTKEACPTAPTNSASWVEYSSLRFVMPKSKRIETFNSMIVSLFCVPRSAFMVIRMTHDKTGKQVVYVAFTCTGVNLSNGQPACDSVERTNYAVALSESNSTFLRENGIEEIVGSTSIAISSDDPDILPRGRSILLTLFICTTLVVCTAILVTGFLKYRQQREYFVQFGMEDDDVDDMYAQGMMPAGVDGGYLTNVNPYPSQLHPTTMSKK